MFGSKIKECKLSRNDPKVVSVIEMTFLYEAQYSVVLLRQKNEVKPFTQSAAKWICMGKWSVPTGGILFLRLQKGPRRSDFSGALFAANAAPGKILARTDEGAGTKK